MIRNKYNSNITEEMLLDYYNRLIADFFKILPIFESSYNNFSIYIDSFIVEMSGACELFCGHSRFIKLLNSLEGMKKIKQEEHKKLKSLVFGCISSLEKAKKELV